MDTTTTNIAGAGGGAASLPAADAGEIMRLMAGSPLLLVEESHAEQLRRRFVGRPVGRGGADDDKRGPESVARFPNAAQTGGYGYVVDASGIAIVSIKGAITPEAWAWYDDYETISDWVVRDLDAMAADPNVKGVLFVVSSPGGYVAGSFEMADAIARLAAAKPTATFATGYCCSAAYLQAAGTGHVTAYKTAIVGSIGTRSAVYDFRSYFEKFGIKAIPIDSGGMKSAGLPGTEITAEQIAYFRGTVLKLQEQFTKSVAEGRGMSIERAQQLADGRVHVAGDGKALGIIDAVGTTADAYAMLTKMVGKKQTKSKGAKAGAGESASQATRLNGEGQGALSTENDSLAAGADAGGTDTTAEAAAGATTSPPTGSEADSAGAIAPAESETQMSQQQNGGGAAGTGTTAAEAKAATMKELKAACPGASSDFLVEQNEAGATVAQAKDAFLDYQAAQIRSRDEELAKLKTAGGAGAGQQREQSAGSGGGTRSIETGAAEGAGGRARAGGGGGDAVAEFNSAVEEQMAKPGFKDNRKKAIAAVCKSQPDVHKAYLLATNTSGKARAAIQERFADAV